MPLKLYSTASNTNADYMRYVYDSPVKTARENDVELLDFALVPLDASFLKPKRGSYIIFDTATIPKWYTGYLTTDPQLDYLGKHPTTKQPVWGFRFQATSDEYILNLNPIGDVAPFVNQTMGFILKTLAGYLAPGAFDVTGVLDGMTLARYEVDPTKKFGDIVKEFTGMANYRFRAHDKKLTFEPQDATPATISVDGNSKHFTPSELRIGPASEPIVNDATVVGDVEPQGPMVEYWPGDGFTGTFPLTAGIFGVEGTTLLDETFGGAISDAWDVYDSPQRWLRTSNGFLEAKGGNGTGMLDTYLSSRKLFPLENILRITHGEFDFINTGTVSTTQGIICGLWKAAPNVRNVNVDGTFPGCLYGMRVYRDAGGTTYLNQVVSDACDATPGIVIDYTKRYVMRTVVQFTYPARTAQTYSYIDANGVVQNYANAALAGTATLQTFITPVDPTTGLAGTTVVWNATLSLPATTLYANYIPLASNDLHISMTNLTISVPMAGDLDVKRKGTSTWTPLHLGPNEINGYDGIASDATIKVNGGGGVMQRTNKYGSPKYNVGEPTLNFFKDSDALTTTAPQLGDLVRLRYRRPGVSMSRIRDVANISVEAGTWGDSGSRSLVKSDMNPLPRTSEECEAAARAVIGDMGYKHYEGSYNQWHEFEFTGEPLPGTVLKFKNLPVATFDVAAFNETIQEVRSTLMAYKPIERFWHEVSFGRGDNVRKLLAQFQKQNDVYTSANSAELPSAINLTALGRAFLDNVSAPEFSAYTSTQFSYDMKQEAPGKRNLLVWSNDFTKSSNWSNIAWVTPTYGLTAPDGSATASRLACDKVDPDTYIGQAVVLSNIKGNTFTFSFWVKGENTAIGKKCAAFLYNAEVTEVNSQQYTLTGSWQRVWVTGTFNNASASLQPRVDVIDNGTCALTDSILVWGAQLELGSTPTPVQTVAGTATYDGGFEVRYSDDDWGADDGKNLALRTSSQTFSIPRNDRGKVIFVRSYDQRNLLRYSENLTLAPWVMLGATASLVTDTDPDGNIAEVSKVVCTAGQGFYQQTLKISGASSFTLTFWVKGTAGKNVGIRFSDNVAVDVAGISVPITAAWQKVTYSGTFPSNATGYASVFFTANEAQTLYFTRMQMEVGTVETVYCKTNATAYGAVSRYASGISVQLPNVPSAPTAATLATGTLDAAYPVIELTMPTVMEDVWGFEVRKTDGTVVNKTDLINTTSAKPTFKFDNSTLKTRSIVLDYFCYNVLGEYSAANRLTVTLATPTITPGSLVVDDGTKAFKWTATNAEKFDISTTRLDDGTNTVKVIATDLKAQSMQLDDDSFFKYRRFTVTPKDALGSGTAVTLDHVYTAQAVAVFDNTNIDTVVPDPVEYSGSLSDEPARELQAMRNNLYRNLYY